MMNEKYDIKDRSGKKCRERWINHLKPDVMKSPWSPEEIRILFRCQAFYGNQWTEIAKFLPGRTDNSVKNYFYMTLRKRLRLFNKIVAPEDQITMSINELSLHSELTQKVLNINSHKASNRTEVRYEIIRRRSARLQETSKNATAKVLPKVECSSKGFIKLEDFETFASLDDASISFNFLKYEIPLNQNQVI